jgi:acetolactate decarboxylase
MTFGNPFWQAVFLGLILISTMPIHGQERSWPVKHSGAMREMFETGNVEGKIDVGKLTPQKNLYAVGPLENLSGEIMIRDGESLTSFIRGNAVKVETNPAARAVFMVWSNVEKWHEVTVPNTIRTYDELEKFVSEAAGKLSLNAREPFPFLLKGKFQSVAWHVNDYKSDGTPLTRQKHDQQKFKAKSENEDLEMVGFFSPKHQGVFTHHTRVTHIHVTDAKRTFVGHVDDLNLDQKNILFLPMQ